MTNFERHFFNQETRTCVMQSKYVQKPFLITNIFFLFENLQFRNTVKPIGWKHHVCEMGGYRNISLIKWLESTTNKNFKKLYRILDTKKHNGLKEGVYRLQVDNVCQCSTHCSSNIKLIIFR